MGQDKFGIVFKGEALLTRMERQLSQWAAPVIIVAAEEQELPPVGPTAVIVRDILPQEGPLCGLTTAAEEFARCSQGRPMPEHVWVTACDSPFVSLSAIQAMQSEMCDGIDAAVVRHDGQLHPLSAVYHINALQKMANLFHQDERRMMAVCDLLTTKIIDSEQLRSRGVSLDFLTNLNTPEELDRVCRESEEAPDLE